MKLELPWPPSVNRYWRHVMTPAGRRTLISAKGRVYRKQVAQLVLVGRTAKRLQGRLSVSVEAFPPDKRKRDLDNIFKALFDALTHAGVWEDDGQVDRFTVERKTPGKPGRLVVVVEER